MPMYRCMCNHLQRLLLFFSSFFWQLLLHSSGPRAAIHFCIFSVSLVFSLSYFSKIKLQYPLSHFRLLLNAALYNAEITMRLGGCSRVQWTYARTHRHMCICIHTYRNTQAHKIQNILTGMQLWQIFKQCYVSSDICEMYFECYENFLQCFILYFYFSLATAALTRQSITKYVHNKCPQIKTFIFLASKTWKLLLSFEFSCAEV